MKQSQRGLTECMGLEGMKCARLQAAPWTGTSLFTIYTGPRGSSSSSRAGRGGASEAQGSGGGSGRSSLEGYNLGSRVSRVQIQGSFLGEMPFDLT